MAHKALLKFKDTQTGEVYNTGEDVDVSPERAVELSTDKNKAERPVIRPDLDLLNKPHLQELADVFGLDYTKSTTVKELKIKLEGE